MEDLISVCDELLLLEVGYHALLGWLCMAKFG